MESSLKNEVIAKPKFQIYRTLPNHLKPNAFKTALKTFISEGGAGEHVDPHGALNEGLKTILEALQGQGDLWLAVGDDGEIYGYAFCTVQVSIDNNWTYWVHQGWIHRNYRNGQDLRDSWKELEIYARSIGCKHICNLTSRNPKAYLRVLGDGWHTYTTILKKTF